MYSLEEGTLAVKIARATIENHVRRRKIPEFEVPECFNKKSGVFVTINKYPSHELRGCIGYPEPHKLLIDALIDSAKSAATRDPRFPPMGADELDKVVVEVSLLTPPELIKVSKPKDYPKNIKIGEDGLIVEKGMYRGLLLPQVPVEWKWDLEEFLSHTCMKAGLMPDCWLDKNVKIYKFSAKIFSEKTPGGDVEEKILENE
jgi:hypothetical protein